MITLRKPEATLRTLALPQQGPYKVVKHNKNGFIKLELEPNVVYIVNSRKCYPYYMLPEDEVPNVNTQQAVNVPTAFL